METQDIYFKSIHDFLRVFPDEQACINHLTQIRWGGVIVSPFDETSKVYVCAGNKFKCKNTGKYFNCKTGTIFESTNIPLMKWFLALYVFSSHKKGISSYQLAKDIDVTQKSAWFMLHRLRYAFSNNQNEGKLEGVVEADETYIGGKHSNMHKTKREAANAKGTGPINKTAVFGIIERDGDLRTQVIGKTDKATIQPIIAESIEKGSIIITDGHGAYKGMQDFTHEVIEHEKGEFAKATNVNVHTGNIDGFWSQFKRGVFGIYHHISPKHTNAYAQEFTLRHNTRKYSTSSRFDYVLMNMGIRLTYNQLIAK